MESRTKLAVLLIAVILGIHLVITARYQKPRVPPQQAGVAAESLAAVTPPAPGAAPPASTPPQGTIAAPPGATDRVASTTETGPFTPADPHADDIVVETPLQHIRIARAGGLVRELQLLGHSISRTKQPVDLLSAPAARSGRALGVVLRSGERSWDLSKVQFTPSPADFGAGDRLTLASGSGPRTFELRAEAAGGGAFVERYTIDPDRYDVQLELRLEPGPGMPRVDSYAIEWSTGMPVTEDNAKEDEQRFRALAALDQQVIRKRPGDFKNESSLPAAGTLRWAALQNKYFMVGLIPSAPQHGTLELLGEPRSHAVGVRFTQPAPFRSGPDAYRIYAGPIDFDRVKALGVGLESTVELGWRWIRPISGILLDLMQFLYKVLPNWGLVIIVVSALTKLVFWPLTDRAMRSMKRMQELQPRMEEIRRRYANDPKAMNEQIMHMYREQRVNPVGGCMPILVQTPMFFALFAVLQSSIELRNAPFVAWINNLAAPDVLAKIPMSLPMLGDNVSLLPLVMGGTMIWQSILGAAAAPPPTPGVTNPLAQQQFLMKWVMPIMMTVFFYKMPSGLVIYWIVNTLMSIAQQLQVNRRKAASGVLAAAPVATRAEGKASGSGPNRNDGQERGRGAAERPGRARSQGR